MLPQLIVSGLAAGGIYALLALGMVLIFKTTNVLNFAQGEMATISAFIAYTLLYSYDFPYWAAFLAALAFGAFIGMIVERVAIRPVLDAPLLTVVVVTIGLYLVFASITGLIWGHEVWCFPSPFPSEPLSFAGLVISPAHLGILGTTLALVAILFLVLNFTTIGTAVRATCQDRIAAVLMGISSKKIFSLSWAIGSALGAVAGILVAPIIFLHSGMMGIILIKAFATAVLGGVTSLPGALIAGLSLGVMENLVGGYISVEFKNTFAFILIIVVLLVLPRGIFGGRKGRMG